MKIIMLTENEVPAELNGLAAVVFSPHSKSGQHYVGLYGIMAWPAVIVIRDDGVLVEVWQGLWPTYAQVCYHANSLI